MLSLSEEEHIISYNIYSSKEQRVVVENLLDSNEEGNYLLVRNIWVSPFTPSKTAYCVFTLGIIILAGLIFLCLWKRILYENRKICVGLLVVLIVSSYPLLIDYVTYGHDLSFHLMRIEGIKDGLLSGNFPVKLQPTWYGGNGYAAGVMYGDVFLYFPALLRMMGISVYMSYKCYVFAVNFFTVLISYYCFTNISEDKKIGFLGCCVYTLASYRLMDVYTRAAVGEYTALAFYPLVLYGFWLIYKKENQYKAVPVLVIGITGLIQSHVLSCEMITLFVAAVILVLWKKTFTKKVLQGYLKIFGWALAVNAFFVVPFLDYFLHMPLKIKENMGKPNYIQEGGVTLAKLLSQKRVTPDGVDEFYLIRMANTVGIVFLLVLFLWLWGFLNERKFFHDIENAICIIGICVALGLSTVYFPYDWLAEKSDILNRVFGSIQFPWRFLAIAVLLLSWLTCIIFQQMEKTDLFPQCLYALCFVAVLQGLFVGEEILSEQDYIKIYDGSALDTTVTAGKEYLLSGTDDTVLLEYPIASEGISVFNYEKKQGKIYLEAQCEKEGYVDIPLLYYKGYAASDQETDVKYVVTVGENNQVRVEVPSGKVNVQIWFKKPIFWRIAEFVSLVSFVCAGVWLFLIFQRNSNKCLTD